MPKNIFIDKFFVKKQTFNHWYLVEKNKDYSFAFIKSVIK